MNINNRYTTLYNSDGTTIRVLNRYVDEMISKGWTKDKAGSKKTRKPIDKD